MITSKKNYFIFLILLIFFVISLSVDAEKCEDVFGDEGFSCLSGARNSLETDNICKSGRVCEGDYCCGSQADSYCCREKTKCEKNFGDEGFTCMSGQRTDLQNDNICKSGRVCEGDYCCGSQADSYCCKSSSEISEPSQNNQNENILSEQINQYRNLVVLNGISYGELYNRALDINLGVNALYEEASGYKELAKIRRFYLGIPNEAIVARNNIVINTNRTRPSVQQTSAPEPEDEQTEFEQGQSCGEGFTCVGYSYLEGGDYNEKCTAGICVGNNYCCENSVVEELGLNAGVQQTNKNECDVASIASRNPARSRDILLDGSGRNYNVFFENGFWYQCRTGIFRNSCSETPDKVDDRSQLQSLGVEGVYLDLISQLIGKDYTEGLDAMLIRLVKYRLRNNDITIVINNARLSSTKSSIVSSSGTRRLVIPEKSSITFGREFSDAVSVSLGDVRAGNSPGVLEPEIIDLTREKEYCEAIKAIDRRGTPISAGTSTQAQENPFRYVITLDGAGSTDVRLKFNRDNNKWEWCQFTETLGGSTPCAFSVITDRNPSASARIGEDSENYILMMRPLAGKGYEEGIKILVDQKLHGEINEVRQRTHFQDDLEMFIENDRRDEITFKFFKNNRENTNFGEFNYAAAVIGRNNFAKAFEIVYDDEEVGYSLYQGQFYDETIAMVISLDTQQM